MLVFVFVAIKNIYLSILGALDRPVKKIGELSFRNTFYSSTWSKYFPTLDEKWGLKAGESQAQLFELQTVCTAHPIH